MTIGIDGNEANVKNRVGSGTYVFELLKQFHSLSLLAMTKEENHFCIFLKEKPLPDLPKETENFKYKIFGPKKLWTQFALPLKLTFGSKLDVFFSPAHYGPRFSRIPYVVTIHDLSYLHFPQMFRRDDLLQLTAWSKYSIENSAHIITPSQATKDDIVKNYNMPPSKITVTYEGYDKFRFKPQPKTRIIPVKKKYHIKGDYIIFVGTLQPRKNLERLIEAFSKLILNSQLSTLNLVIAGKKGWLYEPIFQKVKQLRQGKRVIFTDYVPDNDLPALIGGASVYVLPSLWEGFGIPVIEAQACGVPVVVSNTSSLPEIINPSNVILTSSEARGKDLKSEAVISGSGILVYPENIESITYGIQKALDLKVRSDLINRGYQNIKRFSWEKCARETLKIFETAANSR